MVKYRRTGSDVLTNVTSGAGVLGIPNYGLTVISATSTNDWAMQAPVAGLVKRIVVMPATSGTLRTIRLSSASSGDSITALGATGDGVITELNYNSTSLMYTELVGLSATQWKILYSTTGIPASPSTGIIYQTS
jgi:hypothetical protein